MPTETELKLGLPAHCNDAFRRLLADQPPPVTEQLYSIYYDTPGLTLARRDIALRLRRVEGRWLQTLKLGEQAGAGLHRRIELEQPVAGRALELEQLGE